jgi:hypothetical protein
MIPVSKLFSNDPFDTDANLQPGPGEGKEGQKRLLVIHRRKKISFPPAPDDHEEKEVRDISPEGEVVKRNAVVRDPNSGDKVEIDEPPVVIRRKGK